MPAHFIVASHDAKRVESSLGKSVVSSQDLLDKTWGKYNNQIKCAELLQSSFGTKTDAEILACTQVQRNGFVDTIILAYNTHHHLTIRPDDLWMAILGQFNFYVNAHAEDLRSHFVAHEGKKEVVIYDVGTRYTVDFGVLANRLSDEIDKNSQLVDKDFKAWIFPNFTTTTHNDTVICSVLMMATLNAYFDRKIVLRCGIPSVTLEGQKEDWEKILVRLDKLSSFGQEPTAWATLLRPIITRFVNAFDEKPDIDFWNRVCHVHPGGSGPSYLSGWITAFCVWTNEGRWLGPPPQALSNSKPTKSPIRSRRNALTPLIVDNIEYPIIETSDVPVGFCEVDIKLDDNGQLFDCMMVAGHLGCAIEGDHSDSLRPSPGWFMFIRG